MNWDQPEFSFDQAQPPTPTKTPTSPSFADVFQTPRLDWNLGDGSHGTPNLLKTPRALLFSTPHPDSPHVTSRSFSSDPNASGSLALNAEKLLATPSFEALPADHTPRFPSSPNVGTSKSKDGGSQLELSLDTSTSFNSASSMQTPPPTTTSATKRKAQREKADSSAQQSQSTAGRRTSVPLAPKPTQTTPLQTRGTGIPLGPLDLSPDVFGFDFISPATAPPVPTQRLPWSGSEGHAEMDFLSQDTNIFDTPGQGGLDPFDLAGVQSANCQAGMASNQNQQSGFVNAQSLALHNDFMASLQNSHPADGSGRAYGNGVDPSLLFSSPSKLPAPPDGSGMGGAGLNEERFQPYAYQVQEAKREKAYGGIAKFKKKRKPSVDSPAVQAALETLRDDKSRRPQIRRSMTDSVVSAVSRDSRASNHASSHGRSSPEKKNRKSKHRTSLALTIDENGKARMETRVIQDTDESDDDNAMELDRRSNGEEGSSSSEGEYELPVIQQSGRPKLGRFNQSASHSQKSSMASASSQPSHSRPTTSIATMNHSRGLSNAPLQPLKEASFGKSSEAETVMDSSDENDQNAQSELRKIIQRRHSTKRSNSMHHGYSPENGGPFHSHDMPLSNLSPTTLTDPDLATPSSAQSSAFGAIRCVCSSHHDEGQMIQCESCRNWLHVPCTGLQPNRLPEIYLCLFCTGSTPVARGGRVRDPARKAYVAPSSPLAHKTARFR